MSQNIVADYQIGWWPAGNQIQRCGLSKNRTSVGTPVGLPLQRHSGPVRYREPECLVCEVLKQVAVVARDFENPASSVEAEPRGHRFHVIARVLQPAVGVGREVGVVRKNGRRVFDGLELDEEARAAHPYMEWIERFTRFSSISPDVRVRERRHAEIDERVGQRGAAAAAADFIRGIDHGRIQRPDS